MKKVAFIQRNWEDNPGLLWISALLRRHGFDARVWVEEKDTYPTVQEFDPDVVGYSCMTGDQQWVFSSIEKVRQSGITAKAIVGGPHATFFPELIENPLVDIICRGEGELAMVDYMQALENGTEPYGIKNLYFRVGDQIIKNDLRPLISDLDELPLPDRSYYERYPFLASNPYRTVITSRGCPFGCTFCFNHALHDMYGRKSKYIRRRSVENVMTELVDLRDRWGIDEIRFSDDHFALNAGWLKEFLVAYQEDIARPFSINARVDVLDEEKISLLAQSGCRLVCFGIETGREDVRNRVLKKNIKDEQIYEVAGLLKKYRIKSLTSNIIGLPNETPEDAWKTIEINQKIRADLPWFSMMQYYPGTQIYAEAQELGLLSEEHAVDAISSYFENKYLEQENMDELQNIHSFSILTSRYPIFEPLARVLVRRFKPNWFFRCVFKVSYLVLTARRANFSLLRLLKGLKYYARKIRR